MRTDIELSNKKIFPKNVIFFEIVNVCCAKNHSVYIIYNLKWRM